MGREAAQGPLLALLRRETSPWGLSGGSFGGGDGGGDEFLLNT